MKNIKKIYTLILTVVLINIGTIQVFAEGTWGENTKNWIVREATFIAMAVIVVIMIPLVIKKAWATLLVTLFASSIAIFFISKPEALKAIGNIVSRIVFGDDVDV